MQNNVASPHLEGVKLKLSLLEFGCEKVHADPKCCEQAADASNCYLISCTTTTQSFFEKGDGVGGLTYFVVTLTSDEV